MLKQRLSTVAIILIVLFLTLQFLGVREESAKAQVRDMCVVIDAGHGGIDGGSVGRITGVYEADINLAVANALAEKLTALGIRAVQTRSTKEGLYGEPTAGFKRRDMVARKRIIEAEAPDLVVSIHQNEYAGSTRCGAQVFFCKESSFSGHAALCIQNELNASVNKRRLDALFGDYYIVKCTGFPSVIVECGFLSNAEEEALLQTEEYQHRLAETIARGIIRYFSETLAA
ncbi:MAG: N-acetylmuramoyl-L-alanine amidase [Clostridia bacterium]|nr:N-acetylmuramoyl-L-alanine amidase [Clostridia bacterium]